MNLIIDIGNTLSKYYIFQNDEIIYENKIKSTGKLNFIKILEAFPCIKNAIISTVGKNSDIIPPEIFKKLHSVIVLDHETPLPIKNKYKTKKTLGKDRIAAVVGAYNKYPDKNVLVIDAGTAITFDFLNKKGEYEGGNISPGLSMRYHALHSYTEKLPLLLQSNDYELIGQTTDEAIISGVQNGIIFETEAYINKFQKKYDDLIIILTGGDSFFFANKLKNRIFANSNLVAFGLNRILKDNVKKI